MRRRRRIRLSRARSRRRRRACSGRASWRHARCFARARAKARGRTCSPSKPCSVRTSFSRRSHPAARRFCRAPTTSTRLSWTRRRRRWSASSSWRWRGSPSGACWWAIPRSCPRRWRPTPRARQGHDRSCMRRLLDAAAEDASRASHASHDSWYTLLDTQYRMHPAISSFPSRRFYESSVRDAGSTQTVPFFLLPERVSTREKTSRKNRARLERTGRVRRGDDDDDANARVTKKKSARRFARGSARRSRSWTRRSPPGAVRRRGGRRSRAAARTTTASLGNDAEAELAAALARALPWAMGGANDTTRRDAFERSSNAASSVARFGFFGFFGFRTRPFPIRVRTTRRDASTTSRPPRRASPPP